MDGRYDSLRSSERCEAANASGNNTTGNMFSNDSCFMGGSYYHVGGDAYFSPLLQIPPGASHLRSLPYSVL